MRRLGDGAYFDWLYAQVADPNDFDTSRSRRCLIEMLAHTPFEPRCTDDENRRDAVDEIRYRAAEEYGVIAHWRRPTWLEVLIELAEQADFWASGTDAEQPIAGWFWEFLDNAGLAEFSDGDWPISYEEAERRMNDVLTGKTSFFGEPSRNSLWVQLGGYILTRTDLV